MKLRDKLNDLDQAEELADQVEEKLYEVRDLLAKLRKIIRPYDASLAGRIQSYSEPWIEAWAEDKHQPGGVPDIQKSLEKLRDED